MHIEPSTLSRIPPGLRFSLDRAFEAVASESPGDEPGGAALRELWRQYDEAEPWVGLEPRLAEPGYAHLERSQHPSLRTFACSWLTLFPNEETARRLAAVALASDEPQEVRAQAVWALGFRQSRGQPGAVRWSEAAIRIADEALIELATKATDEARVPFEELPLALRHVQAPELSEVFLRAPLLWGAAYEAFATPALARCLLDRIDELPNDHQLRAVRLAAATLGAEAIDRLHAKIDTRIPDPMEHLFLALTFGGEAQRAAFDARVEGLMGAPQLRKRAEWHLANPGVVPTVRALQTARSAGVMAGDERKVACARAADDFAALTTFARHPETYLYTLWAVMVNGAGDLARARTLANARPESRKEIRSLYLEDLAKRGRARQLIASAQQLEGVEEGAYWLAVYGRPFLALELAATSRLNTPEVAVARTLALHRAGRPDLARRVLTEELPPAEVTSLDVMPTFPGADEAWRVEHHANASPATTALVKGMEAVVALGEPAVEDAELDSFSFETVGRLERWLARPIDGATVYLAGEFPGDSKARHAAAIEERGGRLVDGPFPGTHYYVMGLTCLVTTIAQLERQGTRRIRNEELGLSW